MLSLTNLASMHLVFFSSVGSCSLLTLWVPRFLSYVVNVWKKIFATKKNTNFLLVLHKKIIRKYVTKRQGFQEIQVLNYVWKMKHLNHKYGKTFTITFNLKICCDFFRQTPAANFFCVLQFWNGTFLHALFWRSVWKIFPSVIWYFSWISRLEKWRTRFFLRSRAKPETSECSEASIFLIKISKKNIKLHEEKFSIH